MTDDRKPCKCKWKWLRKVDLGAYVCTRCGRLHEGIA